LRSLAEGVVRRIFFGLACLLASAAPAVAGFDAPLKTEIIPTTGKAALHCLTFPNFLLKWEEDGPITPVIYILKGKGPWTCAATMKGELHFGSWPIVRVKGPYIVLHYNPRAAYGSPFTVFDTRRWRYVDAAMTIGDFTAVRLDGEVLVLDYRRQVSPECSLYYGDATECWGIVKKQSGLTDAMMPDCRTPYEKAKRERDVADITDYPAIVTYNAEARIADGKVTYMARSGLLTCEPQDFSFTTTLWPMTAPPNEKRRPCGRRFAHSANDRRHPLAGAGKPRSRIRASTVASRPRNLR
jgi:hypothetical protein